MAALEGHTLEPKVHAIQMNPRCSKHTQTKLQRMIFNNWGSALLGCLRLNRLLLLFRSKEASKMSNMALRFAGLMMNGLASMAAVASEDIPLECSASASACFPLFISIVPSNEVSNPRFRVVVILCSTQKKLICAAEKWNFPLPFFDTKLQKLICPAWIHQRHTRHWTTERFGSCGS